MTENGRSESPESDAQRDDPASFVRGFFLRTDEEVKDVACLHGWEDGFTGDLSDVDAVMSKEKFPDLVSLVRDHSNTRGWRLCQVLRHESTAAFCVCSSRNDPARVVALDVCSDYRRNERLLIGAVELLAGRERLPWGGHRLCRAMELRYRFIKGAVKSKNAEDFVTVFNSYPAEARSELEKWLSDRWDIIHASWDEQGLSQSWTALERKTREARVDGRIASWKRILARVFRPTGIVVAGMNTEQDKAVAGCFGRLYFRRQLVARRFRPVMWQSLVTSTLVRCHQLNAGWKALLGKDLWIEATPDELPEQLVERIASHLEDRCARREGLSKTR